MRDLHMSPKDIEDMPQLQRNFYIHLFEEEGKAIQKERKAQQKEIEAKQAAMKSKMRRV